MFEFQVLPQGLAAGPQHYNQPNGSERNNIRE